MGRREFLRCGIAGLTSLTLPALLKLRAEAPVPGARERTALVVVWLHGGASHLETYDPKPEAPAEFRGPYLPISTKVPGLQLCELLPRHAAMADKFTILRSMVHTGFCHQQGAQQMFTGHPVREMRNKPDHPDCFSIVSRMRNDPGRALPNYVGVPPVPYTGSAYLGLNYEPFAIGGDPNAPNFQVPNIGLGPGQQTARLESRIGLRQQFDRLSGALDLKGNMEALDTFQQQAWNMLTSPATRDAFDLSKEDPRLRDRYGRTSWGQQCLMARRLVEAGVDLVTTALAGKEAGPVHNWDDHAVNHHVFNAMKARAGNFDQAVTALIEDLYERGLDRRVMVVVTGEFGRTPKISYDKGQPGRDHWPNATSMLFAGGGMRTGQVIGATDKRGEQVIERRVGVNEFLATVYHHLGVNTEGLQFNDFSGRPIPVPADAKPIRELLGT
ncbi:MAG: DUF1501 domain-containing protein [Planctomycetia bacterium]|nr:DUF1501 domain-containing protein [Planctomycetia bacterium]